MKNTKLLRLLLTFDAFQLGRFGEFVRSPFFNTDKNLQKLFEYLHQAAPDYTISKEDTFHFIFERQPFDQPELNRLMSELYKLAVKFIAHQEDLGDNMEEDIKLLRYYNNVGLVKEFEKHLNTVLKKHQVNAQDDYYFYRDFLIQQEISRLESTRKDKGTGDVNLENTAIALDKYYLIMKLILLCQEQNRKAVAPGLYKADNFEHYVLQQMQDHSYWEVVNVKAWYLALQLLRETDKMPVYLELKKLVFEKPITISLNDTRNLCTFLQNNARSLFHGDAYYEELFELYRFQLDHQVFSTELYIATPIIFFNIFNVALKLKKMEWIEKFLATYKNTIVVGEQSTLDLCYSLFDFKLGKYEAALEKLSQCKATHRILSLQERRLQLMLFYELKYHNSFEDGINSFRVFLTHHQKNISTLHLTANREFLNFAHAIYRIEKSDKKKIKLLIKEIENANNLPEKDWLLEKSGNL